MNFEQAVEALELTEPCTDVPITPQALLETLKQDVVYAAIRPGSWEGSNMIQVLFCHGFIKDE